MSSPNLSNSGRQFLNRRAFLGDAATGLSSIALLDLLAGDRLLAGQPQIDPARPFAARPGHYAAKAKNVLVIFCAGGVSGFLYGIDFSFREMRHHAEHMDELPDNAIPRMAEDLSLSAEQLPEFDRIFRKYHVDIERI